MLFASACDQYRLYSDPEYNREKSCGRQAKMEGSHSIQHRKLRIRLKQPDWACAHSRCEGHHINHLRNDRQFPWRRANVELHRIQCSLSSFWLRVLACACVFAWMPRQFPHCWFTSSARVGRRPPRGQGGSNMTPWEPQRFLSCLGFAGILTAVTKILAETYWASARLDIVPLLVMARCRSSPSLRLRILAKPSSGDYTTPVSVPSGDGRNFFVRRSLFLL